MLEAVIPIVIGTLVGAFGVWLAWIGRKREDNAEKERQIETAKNTDDDARLRRIAYMRMRDGGEPNP